MTIVIFGMILLLVLFLAAVAVGYYVYKRIKQKVSGYSRMIWGTEDVREGIDRMHQEYATTPKSVSSATSLYLPRITRDFPEFHYEEMKERAENVLVSFLQALDRRDSQLLTEGTVQLKEKLSMQIAMIREQGMQVHYDGIKVHRTEIYQYRREKGRCSVVFQSAVEYVYYAEKAGEVVAGRKELRTQAKYNIQMIYIQDQAVVESSGETALGLNCPNCGGPLTMLGAKVCPYCDSPVVEFNLKVWNFSDVEEV